MSQGGTRCEDYRNAKRYDATKIPYDTATFSRSENVVISMKEDKYYE